VLRDGQVVVSQAGLVRSGQLLEWLSLGGMKPAGYGRVA
jgi:hypothetical protein